MSPDRANSGTFDGFASQQQVSQSDILGTNCPDQIDTSEFPLATRLKVFTTKIPPASVTALCGASAGVASGFVICPLDVIKTNLQAQGGFRRNVGVLKQNIYHGMFGTGREIWREDGLRGFYKGLGPITLGYLPTWATYMTVYDWATHFFGSRIENWWLSHIASSVVAGGSSTIATNPIWVIKTRLMTQGFRTSSEDYGAPTWNYRNTWDAARKMYRSEGIRAFYSGLSPALLGLSHVAIQFPLYEFFKVEFTGCHIGETPPEGASANLLGTGAASFLSKVFASTATYPHEILRTRLQTQQRRLTDVPMEGIEFRGIIDTRHLRQGSLQPEVTAAASSDGMPNRPRYRGIVRTFKVILREEGWRSFYAGIGVNLFRAVPAAMTTMLTYEYVRELIRLMQREGEEVLRDTEASAYY